MFHTEKIHQNKAPAPPKLPKSNDRTCEQCGKEFKGPKSKRDFDTTLIELPVSANAATFRSPNNTEIYINFDFTFEFSKMSALVTSISPEDCAFPRALVISL